MGGEGGGGGVMKEYMYFPYHLHPTRRDRVADSKYTHTCTVIDSSVPNPAPVNRIRPVLVIVCVQLC